MAVVGCKTNVSIMSRICQQHCLAACARVSSVGRRIMYSVRGLKYINDGLKVEGRVRLRSVGERSGSTTNVGDEDPTGFSWLSSLIDPSNRLLIIDNFEDSPVVAAMDRESAPRDIVHLTQSHGTKKRGKKASVLGNEPGVRIWNGTIESLPAYMGPFEAICAQLSALYCDEDRLVGSERKEERLGEALQKASLMMRPGGKIILWDVDSELVNAECIRKFVHNLCFELLEASMSPSLRGHHHVAILGVPENFALSSAPIYLEGTVVTGYGRGSKDLGVPTANLDPLDVGSRVKGLPDGVYFGWAQLDASSEACLEDRSVHKMVMNIGNRPTYIEDNSSEKSIEVHVMHKYRDDFYGKKIKVIMLGYLRPELKFSGLKELLHRIYTDIGISKSQLDVDRWLKYADDPFFD